MALESDEHIALRKQRERQVTAAWRKFRAESKRGIRRQLAALPAANPRPKAIIVTRNHHTDASSPQTRWRGWGSDRRR